MFTLILNGVRFDSVLKYRVIGTEVTMAVVKSDYEEWWLEDRLNLLNPEYSNIWEYSNHLNIQVHLKSITRLECGDTMTTIQISYF